jgi:hypothetical protein
VNTILLLALAATAQVDVLIDVPPGVYVVRIEANADGTSSVTRLHAHKLDGEDKPDPPEDPDVGEPTEFRAKVTKWAKELDDKTGSQLLAKAYEVLHTKVLAGNIKPTASEVDKAITETINETIRLIPRQKENWRALHEKVIGELAVRLIAANGELTAKQYSDLFRDASQGLKDVGGVAPALLIRLLLEWTEEQEWTS